MLTQDDLQFGRFIEVEIKNFKTSEKITIGNEFKIEFSFYKTIDEVNEASVGNVKIYGLTEETRKSLGGSGNEITLRCGYVNSEIKTLFIADIVRIRPEYSNSETVVSIDVSANFMNYAFSKTAKLEDKNVTIKDRALAIGLDMGAVVFWDISSVGKENTQAVTEFLKNRVVRNGTWFQNSKQSLDNLCETFGFTYTFGHYEPDQPVQYQVGDNSYETLDVGNKYKLLMMIIPPEKSHIISSWANSSYPSAKPKNVTKQDLLDEKIFNSLFVTSEDESRKNAYVLSKETGMIGFPKLEEKIVKVPENWKVNSNEEVDRESLNTVNEKKKQIADKQQKRLADGKKVSKTKPKDYTIKVNRRYVSVSCLLNPAINPQSHVKIISLIPEANGIYRVRSIKYDACNRDGSFLMTLDCEDSSGNKDFELTREQIKQEQNNTLNSESSELKVNTENLGSDNTELTTGE